MEKLVLLFATYGYQIIFWGILLDNAGLPIPGELLIVLASSLSAQLDLHPMKIILLSTISAMLGDHFSYFIGRKSGTRFIDLYCKATLCSLECSKKTQSFYKKFGGMAIVFARFVMGVRALAVPTAGMIRMPYLKFLLWDLVGSISWASLYTLGGYFLGRQLIALITTTKKYTSVILLLLLVALIVYVIAKYIRLKRYGAAKLRVEEILTNSIPLSAIQVDEMVIHKRSNTTTTNYHLF